MTYNIAYKGSVKRDLKSIVKPEARHILDQLEADLSSTPDKCPSLKGEFEGLRKYRLGNYRVIFAILRDTVLVLRIGHRKDVYR